MVEAAPGSTLHFDGLTDAQGNLYWRECSFESCDSVSVTLHGFPRIRETMFAEDVAAPPADCSRSRAISWISTLRPGFVQAFDSASGELRWSSSLDESVQDGSDAAGWLDAVEPPVVSCGGRNRRCS